MPPGNWLDSPSFLLVGTPGVYRQVTPWAPPRATLCLSSLKASLFVKLWELLSFQTIDLGNSAPQHGAQGKKINK